MRVTALVLASRRSISATSATSSAPRGKDADPFAGNPLIQKGFRIEKPSVSKKPGTPPQFSKPDYEIGDTVSHTKFGTGTVLDIQKNTKDYVVTVNFESAGTKKMMAGFAKLTKM